jgi:hypothetical protein
MDSLIRWTASRRAHKMIRRLVVLGCSGFLALGLAFATIAGTIVDADGDGVPDGSDNCDQLANGPMGATGACDGQEDGDLDGYGNACDYDVDNDLSTSLIDVAAVLDNFAVTSTDPIYDFDCDGSTSLIDVAGTLDNFAVTAQPGTSGLPCAGTPVCTAP